MGHADHSHVARVKRNERLWQERQGGGLQERAYQRAGTRVVLHRQFGRIFTALDLRPGMRHLDVGCGVGHLLAWLAQRTPADYHGLDLSLNSATAARRSHPSLRIVAADAERLPYASGRFDRISCNGSAHHLLNLRPALLEMHRVLSPDGKIVMYEPVANGLTNLVRRALVGARYESPADLDHKNEFTRHSVSTLLREIGFANVAISAHDCLAYPLSGMYIDLPLGRSESAMEWLSRVESRLETRPVVGALCRILAWRWLIVASKP